MLIQRSVSSMAEAAQSIERTTLVSNTSEALLSQVRSAQNNRRAFALTGNPKYLERFSSAVRATSTLYARLAELSVGDDAQRRRVSELKEDLDRATGEMEQFNEIRSASGFDPQQQILLVERGTALVDELHRQIGDIEEAELQRLNRESLAMQDGARVTSLATMVGSLFAIGLVLGAGLLLERDINARQRTEAALREAHTLLEERVQERTAELATANEGLRLEAEIRSAAESKVVKQVQNLAALRAIDVAITSSLDLRVTLNVVLDHVTAELQTHAAAVFLVERSTQQLLLSLGRGITLNNFSRILIPVGKGLEGEAASRRETIVRDQLAALYPASSWRSAIEQEGFVAGAATPLIAKGKLIGVLAVFQRTALEPDQEWLDFFEALAGQTAIAVDNAALFGDLAASNEQLARAYDQTIEGWSRALDLRDHETEGHSLRVTEKTLQLANRLSIKPADLVHVRRGALLHDIGKMGVADNILLKPGPLTTEEWIVMKQHPVFAMELLSPIDFLQPAICIPYCHHEKWDGSGYPRALRGEQIPLSARIFAVVDVWDALRSDRPYRKGWSHQKVLDHLEAEAGKHFDPQVVEAFLQMERSADQEDTS